MSQNIWCCTNRHMVTLSSPETSHLFIGPTFNQTLLHQPPGEGRQSRSSELSTRWTQTVCPQILSLSFSPKQNVPPSQPGRSGQTRGHRPEEVLTHSVDLSQVQVVGSTSCRSPQTPQPVSVSKCLNTRCKDATWISNKLDHLTMMKHQECTVVTMAATVQISLNVSRFLGELTVTTVVLY